MAWQNSAGLGGSGGSASGGSEAGNGGGQPQGIEYTLQGERTLWDEIILSEGIQTSILTILSLQG